MYCESTTTPIPGWSSRIVDAATMPNPPLLADDDGEVDVIGCVVVSCVVISCVFVIIVVVVVVFVVVVVEKYTEAEKAEQKMIS